MRFLSEMSWRRPATRMDLVSARLYSHQDVLSGHHSPDHCKQLGPSRTVLDAMDTVYDVLGLK